MIFYGLVILSVLLASVAQMLLKKGASLPHGSFLKEYLNPWVIGGYALMGVSLLMNVFAMSRGIQVKEVNGTYDGLFNLVENLANQEGGE